MNKRKLTVMIVDDDLTFVEELSELLQSGGYRPVVCTVASVALPVARQQQPDIILLDINLGGVDGYQLAEVLRQDEQLAQVPIIAMSAYFERRPYEAIGKHYRIHSFLNKPFRPLDIISKIEEALASAPQA